MSEIVRAFLDDTAQIIGPKFSFDQDVTGRSDRETEVAKFVLEKAELVYNEGKKLGGVVPLGRISAWVQHRVYLSKYSKPEEGDKKPVGADVVEMSNDELMLRESIVEYGNKLVEEGLVQGTWGNISIRLNKTEMLVTPSGIAYDKLTPNDIIKVNYIKMKYQENGTLKPTSEKALHAQIYKKRNDVWAVVHTHSTYCSVFAACEKGIPVPEEKKEKYTDFVKCAPYGTPGSERLAEDTALAFGKSFGALMAHHGMVAGGRSLEQAFDNCREIEKMAKDHLDSLK